MDKSIPMKSKLVSAFFALVLVASTTDLSAGVIPSTKTVPVQTFNSSFGSFRAHRDGKGITLSWSTATPQDIDAFEVEWSYDGEFYECVASASCDNSTRFKFAHANAIAGYNYYRVAAHKKDGTVEYSQVEVVRIVSRK